jgi:hypothetical protein
LSSSDTLPEDLAADEYIPSRTNFFVGPTPSLTSTDAIPGRPFRTLIPSPSQAVGSGISAAIVEGAKANIKNTIIRTVNPARLYCRIHLSSLRQLCFLFLFIKRTEIYEFKQGYLIFLIKTMALI